MAKTHPSRFNERTDRLFQRAAATIAALLCAVSLPGAADAAESAEKGDAPSYRILVLPYASIHGMLPSQIGERSTQFLKNELRGTDGVRLAKMKRTSDASVVNPTPDREETKLNRAVQSAAEAQSALEMGEFTTAIAKFHQAIDIELAQHPYADFAKLQSQYIGLAVASFQLGEEDEGERYLETAARLDTTKRLDAKSMPPVFVRAYNEALRRVKDQPVAGIFVESTVPESTVYLDGKRLGGVPLKRDDLPPGTHYLKVVPEKGSTIWAQPVDLISGRTLKVSASIDLVGGALADVKKAVSENQLTKATVARAVELASETSATHVVIGGVHQDKDGIAMTSFLYSLEAGTLCPLERAVFDSAMMGAGIELYKVGADIVRKLERCDSPRTLPTPVAKDAPPRAAQASWVSPDALAVFQAYTHSPSTRHSLGGNAADDGPRRADLSTPIASEALDDEPGSNRPWTNDNVKEVKEEKKNLTWLWITLGVVAAAGIATGGYFIYDANNSPKATGSISWAM